jgi:hypothetical protein
MQESQTPRSDAPGFQRRFLDSAAFGRAQYPRGWLIDDVLMRGQPAVGGGPKKSLKTSLVIDMAISVGTGTPYGGGTDTFTGCTSLGNGAAGGNGGTREYIGDG